MFYNTLYVMLSHIFITFSKEEKKAYMLNRVQQAKYERQLLNISIESKFNSLSAIHGISVMTRKQDMIEKCKERVAREKAQRRNLEDVSSS